MRESYAAKALFRLDVCSLHDRPPFLGLGLLEGSERCGRLLIGWWNLLAKFAKPLLDGSVGKHGDDGRVELCDDLLWRVLRCPDAVPVGDVEPGKRRLVDGRDIGRGCEPRRR